MRNPYRTLQRGATLLCIIAAHLLCIELLFRQGKTSNRSVTDDAIGEIFFIDPPRPPQALPQPAVAAPRITRASARRASEPSKAITLPPQQVTPIDWFASAREAAMDPIERPAAPHRKFGTHAPSPYEPKKPYRPGYVWQPQEKRAGFSGGMPYVRVGKHCVIVPPFFSCAIGRLPHRNDGATLQEMRDPKRPQSSVPDANP